MRIHLNGLPGVGKLTIARSLHPLHNSGFFWYALGESNPSLQNENLSS